ncbi:DUF2336 domain-containing protein [Zavarzinia sp. CC-PAN008]|uniref:DUF2336 domain-containing protein n=1 Tax=Zavarzinia sp. CC-PAN008 TaxID=3243332 RepID=UPI003F7499CD
MVGSEDTPLGGLKLETLERMGRDANTRQALVEVVPKLLIDQTRPLNSRERELIDEILLKLLDEIAYSVRRELSRALAERPDAPPGLVAALARDEITVARPLLERCPLLNDPELIDIAATATRAHRLAMAVRPTLSEEVTDVLIGRNERDVVLALLSNQGAAIGSDRLSGLVRESERDEALRKPLLMRQDLPPEQAYRMFWWVSSLLRRQIMQRFPVDAKVIDAALETATHRALTAQSEEATRTASTLRGVAIPDMIGFVRSGRMAMFMAALAARAGIGIETARRVVLDETGEALGIACRGIGMDRSQYASVALLINYANLGTTMRPEDVSRILAFFDSVGPDQAMNLMRFWDANPAEALH